jgi:hypothetical protein
MAGIYRMSHQWLISLWESEVYPDIPDAQAEKGCPLVSYEDEYSNIDNSKYDYINPNLIMVAVYRSSVFRSTQRWGLDQNSFAAFSITHLRNTSRRPAYDITPQLQK